MTVATTGLLVATAGVVGANIVFFRFPRKRPDRGGVDQIQGVAVFEFVFHFLLFAAVTAVGLTVLLLGLVLAGGLVTRAPLMPLTLLVLTILTAWYARWRLKQARR